MKNKLLIVLLLLLIVALAGAYFFGWKNGREVNKPEISSQIIFDKIQEQLFLVTKSVFLDTDINLQIDNREGWKKIFVENSIKAQSMVRIDVGINLKELKSSDITVDIKNQKIVVYIPKAEILDSSLFGNIELESKKGIWTNLKDFFADDSSEEYNLATKELINQATRAMSEKLEIFDEAYADSNKFITFILTSIAPSYDIELKESKS